MPDIHDVLHHTDWKMLADQKLALLTAMRVADEHGADTKSLEGLLNWIDAIQEAASSDGYPVVWLETE
jgi:hypothetical protein